MAPTSIRSALRIVCLAACAWIVGAGWVSKLVEATQDDVRPPAHVVAVSPDIDTNWRYTRFGWQRVSSWVNPNSYTPRQTLELVHPFVWSGIVLISVIAAMIWSSSEWDLARLFQREDKVTELEIIQSHRDPIQGS